MEEKSYQEKRENPLNYPVPVSWLIAIVGPMIAVFIASFFFHLEQQHDYIRHVDDQHHQNMRMLLNLNNKEFKTIVKTIKELKEICNKS